MRRVRREDVGLQHRRGPHQNLAMLAPRLEPPVPRARRSKRLLSISHSVYGTLLQKSEITETTSFIWKDLKIVGQDINSLLIVILWSLTLFHYFHRTLHILWHSVVYIYTLYTLVYIYISTHTHTHTHFHLFHIFTPLHNEDTCQHSYFIYLETWTDFTGSYNQTELKFKLRSSNFKLHHFLTTAGRES